MGFGLLAPLYSIVLLTLLALALVYFKLPVLPPLSKQQAAVHASKDNQAPTKVPYVFVAACICVFCAMAMMQQSLGFFFIDFYHYTPVEAARQVGFAMMVSAAASLTVQFGWVQKGRLSKETMITLALPLLGLSLIHI